MECYICHALVERHKYTPHVASHVAGSVTRTHSRPDPVFPAFSYGAPSHNYQDIIHPVHTTSTQDNQPLHPEPVTTGNQHQSSHSPVRTMAVSDEGTRRERPTQSNEFEIWHNNYARTRPKYTIIDGEKNLGDSDLKTFREDAQVLRRTTKEEVIKLVEAFEGFSCSDDQRTCLTLVKRAPIFPGLVAYTYTHLVVCPQRNWLGWFYKDDWSDRVSELKHLVDCWKKYDDVWCILACDSIKGGLLKILRATTVEPEGHKCNSALLNGTLVLKHDILNLAASAALCITGSSKEDILNQQGTQLGKLIDIFHDLLESNVELEEYYRRHFLNVLIVLSERCGSCPRGVYITEGAISGLVWKSRGGFGSVSKGRLGSRLVAVKALKRDDLSLHAYSKQLSKEAIVWRYLLHPNCLPLYGVYTIPSDGHIKFALVSPWMDQGTLSDYLKRNPTANRMKLILDVVQGLTYLHTMEPHVAHRDIKPENILITRNGRACLADFGLASVFDTNDQLHTVASQVLMAGTLNYMAPEILNARDSRGRREVNKRACDMYALGCTIYAAYTDCVPFEDLDTRQLLAQVIRGERPRFPAGKIPHDMWSFVENLWHQDPFKRVTAEMALEWIKLKASREGIETSLGPHGEEEWEWRNQPDGQSLWSVSP